MNNNINFGGVGNALSFSMKLQKHINLGDCDRIKDYLTKAFDTVNPTQPEKHPCKDVINEGICFLNKHGWKVLFYDWGNSKGIQLTCISPDEKWYRSHYQH